jgi:DNA-binding GntR family transcriptional regulator
MKSAAAIEFEKPATLRERVEDYLRDAIMQGHVAGGDRLREAELCLKLAVSRSTLREALRTLEAERLVTIEPHRGPSVARMTEKDAREIYAVRALLEGLAAHEFARLASPAQVAALREQVRALQALRASDDRAQLLRAKRRFYDVLLTGSGNDLVREMLLGMLSRINLLRATSFARSERLAESLQEIDAMCCAIESRDAAGAQRAAEQHVRCAERAAMVVLQSVEARATPQNKIPTRR